MQSAGLVDPYTQGLDGNKTEWYNRPMKKAKTKIDPNKLKTRDRLMVALINGATKSSVKKDEKKEENKTRARKKITQEES